MAKKLKSASAALAAKLRALPRRGAEMLRLATLIGRQRAMGRLTLWARQIVFLWDAAGLAVKAGAKGFSAV